MAQNIFGGTTTKNYARGSSPPANSYEWAGAGSAPPTAPKKMPIVVATMRETIVLERKPKKWKYLGIGAALGALLTYIGIGRRG